MKSACEKPMNTKPAGELRTSTVLDGKEVAAELRHEVAIEIKQLIAAGQRQPRLVAVLVGDDPASQTYVASKARACKEVGIAGQTLRLAASISAAELLATIDQLNVDGSVDGILVQLPLPRQIDERTVLERVSPEKDVDGFHPVNIGRLWLGQSGLTPATPTGIIELLRRCDIEISGRHAVVVGRSAIVGKPMAGLLLRHHATVTVCHSRTRDLEEVCRSADILIAAVGRPAMIGPQHVRQGAVVIDVGINRVEDLQRVRELYPGNEQRLAGFERRGYTLVGDVDFHRVAPRTRAITPVPGGVGPLTVAQVIVNTFRAYQRRQEQF